MQELFIFDEKMDQSQAGKNEFQTDKNHLTV